jgi:hypothetical protein
MTATMMNWLTTAEPENVDAFAVATEVLVAAAAFAMFAWLF